MSTQAKRQSLLRIKEDLQKTFCSQVTNMDDLFIISNANVDADTFVQKVYNLHMQNHSLIYFNVLALAQGFYVGSNQKREFAEALQEAFGGKVTRTQNRHIAEWLWEGDAKNLKETEVINVIFNVV